MKKRWLSLMLIAMSITTLSLLPLAWAGEHGGKDAKEHSEAEHAKEHGGKEHGGTTVATAESTPEAVRQAIREFIGVQQTTDGAFTVFDGNALKIRNLELVQVHERVGKTGDYYYSCTDMKDTQTGELLDLDFDVKNVGGNLRVIATRTRIHKVNGGPRYTYDENDNMIAATN